MRSLFILPLLLCAACAPVQVATLSHERLAKGASITIQMPMSLASTGLEHALFLAFRDAGFDVRSANAFNLVVTRAEGGSESEGRTDVFRRFDTRYVCQVKGYGFQSQIPTFSLQILDVTSGKVLLHMASGQGRNHSVKEIVTRLKPYLP